MSIEWYHDAMQEADNEDNNDFHGCPSCLGEDVTYVGSTYDDDGTYEGERYHCNECGQGWTDDPD